VNTQSLRSKLLFSYFNLTDYKYKYSLNWFLKDTPSARPESVLNQNYTINSQTLNQREVWRIQPAHKEVRHSIIFVHGGGFAKGFMWYHWKFIARLVDALDAEVIAPDYPLLPQSNAEQTASWMDAFFDELSDAQNISESTILADSAGAAIALSAGSRLRIAKKVQPKEYVLMSPWLDVSFSNPLIDSVNLPDPVQNQEVLQELGKRYAGSLELTDPQVSPIYVDTRRLAPISVYVGTRDILLADSRKLKVMSESKPVVFQYREFKGMVHNWMYMPLPEAKQAVEMIINNIKFQPSEFEISLQEQAFSW
jgi:acetyl esterase/lipase